jgi:uncharacterized protein YbjQ (UPF0145 family)
VSDEELIPGAARERLTRAGSVPTEPFSSSLGVAEALLVRHHGLIPIAQVMGSSVFQVGWQQMPRGPGWFGGRGQTYELEAQTAAYNDARAKAVERLREEALLAKADAVVGVSLRRARRAGLNSLVEFVAVGTAVRSTRYDLRQDGEPLLCNLSGQDAAKLIAHGFWPTGIVGGSTVAYAASGSAQQWRSQGFWSSMANQELPDFTRGLIEARHMAMQRVERDAHAAHAHGVVGVTFDRRQRMVERGGNSNIRDLIIEIHVIGTAIVEVRHDAPAPPSIALPLN